MYVAITPDPHRRERAAAFARFVWRRFLDDKCFEAAGAMSYTTLFSLVPLATAAFGIIAAFPVFEQWSTALTNFIFTNFVPASGAIIQEYLVDFAMNAKKLTTVGIIFLLFTALMLMAGIENQFNMIWRVPARRRRLTRFVVYWTVLTLGPILLAASLGASSYLFSLALQDDELGLGARLLGLVPILVTWMVLTLSYLVIPNANVRFRNAAIGAVLGTVLFEFAKHGFAAYLSRASYEQVYGALAVIPVFLIWLYVSWTVVLLGASLAASLSAFRFLPESLRVPHGLEFPHLLRVYRRITAAAQGGAPIDRAQLAYAEPGLTDEQLDRFFTLMREHQLIQRTDYGAFVPLRDPATVRISELFESGRFSLPTAAELDRFRARATVEDEPLVAWLTEARTSMHSVFGLSAARVVVSRVESPLA
jgi:membrane protein